MEEIILKYYLKYEIESNGWGSEFELVVISSLFILLIYLLTGRGLKYFESNLEEVILYRARAEYIISKSFFISLLAGDKITADFEFDKLCFRDYFKIS